MRGKTGREARQKALDDGLWKWLDVKNQPAREERWHLATTALLTGLQPRGTKEGGLFGQISQACLSISKSEALAWAPGPEILPLHRHGLVSESPRTPGSGRLLGWVGSAATPRSPRQGTATLTLRV